MDFHGFFPGFFGILPRHCSGWPAVSARVHAVLPGDKQLLEGRHAEVQGEGRCWGVGCLGWVISCSFFQQPERLRVLPIKLRSGLGQPPETLHQVPRGSEGMEPVPKSRFHS